ncbi:ABC transporter permease [Paenibacillus sp. MBLB4367]|uniref:ABC transporter permease n=1 Tax=Paenibacillus sp. MBLB4367 TaxID=3384767 RepID=UPI003908358B
MLHAIKYHATVAGFLIRMAIQRQIEYPLFLVSWLIMIPMQYFAGAWMLNILVERFQALNGWDFPQLAFVYGLGLLSHGVMVVLFIQSWNMDHMVVHGGFDRMLLRPMNVFFQFAFNYFNFIGLIDLIPGTVIFFYACSLVDFDWSVLNIVKLLLVIAGGALIRSAIYTLLGCVAFWTKGSRSLISLTINMMERATLYPLSIYPYALQLLLTFVIPIGFISFYPAADFLGQEDGFTIPVGLAVWTPVVGLLTFFIAHKVFHIGLKKYESSGS